MWCVRINRGAYRRGKLKNKHSGPCVFCKKRLKYLGFGSIAFSNDEGKIEIHKLDNYNVDFYTLNQRSVMTI